VAETPAKTPIQSGVERFIVNAIGGAIENASASHPCPPLCSVGETPSPSTVVTQIATLLADRQESQAAHLALVLACWLARRRNVEMAEALKLAGIAWTQSASLV